MRMSPISQDVLLSVRHLMKCGELIAEAIDFHIEGLQEAGYSVPTAVIDITHSNPHQDSRPN